MKNEKVGIVGFGHLGSALNMGLVEAGYETMINNGDEARTMTKLGNAGLESKAATLGEIARNCETVVLCIKHGELAEVGMELNELLNDEHVVISCLAQATLHEVGIVLKNADPILAKLMTTLGVAERQGVSAIQVAEFTSYPALNRVKRIVGAVSEQDCLFELFSEEQMQLFTAEVGCFPGIMAYILEHFSSGLSRRPEAFDGYDATLPTLLRSVAGLIEASGSARELRESVSTRGGVTQAMIKSLGQSGLSSTMDQMIAAGINRMRFENERRSSK